jgi:hypothetical protein
MSETIYPPQEMLPVRGWRVGEERPFPNLKANAKGKEELQGATIKFDHGGWQAVFDQGVSFSVDEDTLAKIESGEVTTLGSRE